MKAYHGTSASNLIKMLNPDGGLYVTDTPEHASRYANTQATGTICASYKELAEGAVIAEMEVPDADFQNRGENHNTLDAVELLTYQWSIKRVTIRFHRYENTVYGSRKNRMSKNELLNKLATCGIEVNEI